MIVEVCLTDDSGIALEHLIRNGSLPLDWQQQRRMIAGQKLMTQHLRQHTTSGRFFLPSSHSRSRNPSRRKTQPGTRKPAPLLDVGRFSVKSRAENRERKRGEVARKRAPAEGWR
jgi:hypothetical protein